jgi:hypothetical protein
MDPSPNPYQPPRAADAPQGEPGARQNRTLFVLAAIGAGMASLYWAGLTALLGFGTAFGSTPGSKVIVPGVLVIFYAVRAYQIFQGNISAAKRILWLHGVGGMLAVFQMMSGNAVVIGLNAVKIAIHLFGAVTAYFAAQSSSSRD